MDREARSQVPDVVESAARRRTDEGVDARAEHDERLGQVRAHESVRAGDEHGPSAVDGLELLPELGDAVVGPDSVALGHRAKRIFEAHTMPGCRGR